LGLVLKLAGQFREAERAYVRAVQIGESLLSELPEVAPYRQNLITAEVGLAGFLANCQDSSIKNPVRSVALARKAIEHARRGLEKQPRSGPLWGQLIMAYYRAGEWDPCIAAAEKVRHDQIFPDGPDQRYYRAMAYWHRGEKDQARREFNQAAALIANGYEINDQIRQLHSEAADLLGLAGDGKSAPGARKEALPTRPSKPEK
jgi:tetratricopeptide (TPR) repeat protein